MVSCYRATEPQSHRATEPQSHRATEPQSHRATEPQSLYSALLVIFSLLLAITLPSCANVKGLFTEDRNPPNGPQPDPRCLGEAEGDFQAGEGTEASPYLVCTYEQLKKIGEGLDKHYEQGNNINASPSWGEREGAGSCTAYNGSNADTADCAGWVPLGDSSPFRGSFNGRGYVISKLYANVSSDSGNAYAGLFGYLHGNASISNVGLTELRIESTNTSSSRRDNSYTGGLVGRSKGTISNSYATGSVEARIDDSVGLALSSYIGGLLGYNQDGTISNSYAAGSVESMSNSAAGASYAGGLVGYNNDGTISNSYAAGSVEAMIDGAGGIAAAGGLVGRNAAGTISNSYAAGSVEATTTATASSSNAGGLVGYIQNGTISNSYASGSVTASSFSDALSSSNAGGLVGAGTAMIDDTNYYDGNTTMQTMPGCGGSLCDAVGLMTTQMQATSGTPDEYPSRLGPAFSLGGGYPKLYQCKINPTTNACVADSFLPELVPGQ